LDLLSTAAPLVGTTGLPAKWVAMLEAETCAGLNREREARQAIERAYALPDGEDGEGFSPAVDFSLAMPGWARLGSTPLLEAW
jgi:hypothetical protein